MRKSKRSSGSALQETRGDRVIHVVAAVLLGLIILCLFYPMWAVVVASFSNPTELYQKSFLILPTEWTLESYRMVFRDKDFLMGLRNSVLYTVTGTALNVVMNICGAYPLSKRRLKGRSVLMFLFTFTMFFSGGMVPTYLLISRLHLLDTIWAILLPSAVGMYNIIIMRTYFQTTIPQELEDAAEVDGCTNFRFLLSVALPLSRPVIVVIALYYGVGRWNDYFAAMMYLTKRAMYPLQLVLREILLQNQAGDMLHVATDAGYADRMIARMGLKYAVIVISTLPILVIFPFVQRFFAKGVMIGGATIP